ncbi:hypothetical protein, partial [Emticicia sp. C21]|uniref:Kelch repeat-containing protein n=1 Tax=Emticicia sp. C21 TaxID=2302915 RepID=UPI001E613520
MKKSNFFPIIFSLFLLRLIGFSGNEVFAQSTTLATDGVYVPRLTKAQRDAIASPAKGQMIYNTDDDCFNVYQKDNWQKLCSLEIQNTDLWTKKADIGGSGRSGAVGFSIGNKGYIGTGLGNGILKDFWEYNPLTDSWTQKADFGGVARHLAVGFSIGNKGYIGTGTSSDDNASLKDFWEYDLLTNQWTQKADFAGTPRYDAVGFSINNKGYIGTGRNYTHILYNDFWEYDSTSTVNGNDANGNPKGQWILKAEFPAAKRAGAVGFSIGGKGYIGTGLINYNPNVLTGDFYEYNPVTNVWVSKAYFTGTPGYRAVGFSLDNKGYIGTGTFRGIFIKDFWEYDPTSTKFGTDTEGQPIGNWTKKKDAGMGPTASAVGFSIGKRAYVGTGQLTHNSFWEYNPNDLHLTQQGNTFNGATQLVQTDYTGKIPVKVLHASATIQGNTFNGATQLVQTDITSKIPVSVLPATVTTQGNNFNGASQLVQTNGEAKIPVSVLPTTVTT